MAIYHEFIAANGVHVALADDMCAHLTPEEMEARAQQRNRRILEKLARSYLRKLQAESKEQGNTTVP